MSIPLILSALEAELPHVDKLVLIVLCDRAADDGTHCRPGLEYLRKRCGLAVSGVRAATERLEDAGWLVRVPMGQRIHYLLDAPKLASLRSRTLSAPLTEPERSAQGSCSGSGHDTQERRRPVAVAGAPGPAAPEGERLTAASGEPMRAQDGTNLDAMEARAWAADFERQHEDERRARHSRAPRRLVRPIAAPNSARAALPAGRAVPHPWNVDSWTEVPAAPPGELPERGQLHTGPVSVASILRGAKP